MCVLSIKVSIQKSLETYLMILVSRWITIVYGFEFPGGGEQFSSPCAIIKNENIC